MNTLLSQSTPAILELALEYATLATRSRLSEAEADRLGEILEKATEEPILSFWLAELDHLISHHLNLLSEDDRESYKDQQAMMREYGIQNDVTLSFHPVMCPNLNQQALQFLIAELTASSTKHP